MIYEDAKYLLRSVVGEELTWLSHGRVPGQKPDPVNNPWMPFQAAEFIAILAECVAESEGDRFLDIGSGIGTKLMIAEKLFGLTAYGIEYDSDMFRYATVNGRETLRGDALATMPEYYAMADIIWMYRPYRDALKQAQLEHKVFEVMKPGAIIAGANWERKPSGFDIILEELGDDDVSLVRGAWKKPAGWSSVNYEE